jgi:broad specificity phosphatase PhoE
VKCGGPIWLVRHGETEWNVEGRRQGSLDSPLTPRGIEQAMNAGRLFRTAFGERRDVLLECSPLGRAQRTAEILCRELGWPASSIVTQPLLAELRQGSWEGLTQQEIDARHPSARAARERDKWNYVFPGGESYADVALRARAWLAARKPGVETIAVTHEMFSRTLWGAYFDLEPARMLEYSHPHGRVVALGLE